jgi:hypothetical protein
MVQNTYKSKGEKVIANILTKYEFNFKYEFPICVIDDNKTKIWYPDFYLPDFGIIIEFFGLYNSNDEYKKNAIHKKEVFAELGIKLIPVYKIFKSIENYIIQEIDLVLRNKEKLFFDKINKK